MKEYLKNNCAISGSDFESLVSFCKDIAKHTRKREIDFRGSKIFHYYSVNKNIDVLNLMCFDSSSISGIYRIDKRTGLYSLMGSCQIPLGLFRNSKTTFLIDEMSNNSELRTFFELTNKGEKEYLFLGTTCNKTFTSRMPALSFDSSIGRDLYLAEILNTNLEIDSSTTTSNQLGVCSVRERYIKAKEATIAKAVAFFHKDSKTPECDTFEDFITLLEEMTVAHGGAEVVGKWTFDNKILKATLILSDEVDKYPDCDIIPCHTFYMSDTGFVKSKVVPSWKFRDAIIEISKDEKKLSKSAGVTSYQLALEESYVSHMKEYKRYKKDQSLVLEESDFDVFINNLIKTTKIDSSVTGIIQPQLEEFKLIFKDLLEKDVPKTINAFKKQAITALLATKKSSETSTKRIQENFLGAILFF